MNLKITLLIALIISANIFTINAMSNEEKNDAIEEIYKIAENIKLLNLHIELYNRATAERFNAWPPDNLTAFQFTFINAKSNFTKAYSVSLKQFQDNIIPETDDVQTKIRFTISRKVIPFYKVITACSIINKIDETLNLLNQK